MLHAQYCLAAWLSPEPPAVCQGVKAAYCMVFSRILLHVSIHLLSFTDKNTFLMWVPFDTVSQFSSKGCGAHQQKAGYPTRWLWHLERQRGLVGFICLKTSEDGVCTHNLICAQNTNTCCCRHAACGFRSSLVKTGLNPSTTAASIFSRNPVLAISEGFRRHLATATVAQFADFYFIFFFSLRFAAAFFAFCGDSLHVAGERKVEGVVDQ